MGWEGGWGRGSPCAFHVLLLALLLAPLPRLEVLEGEGVGLGAPLRQHAQELEGRADLRQGERRAGGILPRDTAPALTPASRGAGHTPIHPPTHTHTDAKAWLDTHTCMYTCTEIHTGTGAETHVHTHASVDEYAQQQMHSDTHQCACTDTHAQTRAYINTCICAQMRMLRVYTNRCSQTQCAYVQRHTHSDTHRHPCR